MPVPTAAPDRSFTELALPYREELLAHCYRMMGSLHDAEDLVQETLLRAWRGYPRFDGRSSLRTWLYRIATNTCLTALGSTHRRVLPSGLGNGTSDSAGAALRRLEEVLWLEPFPTPELASPETDPAAIVARRDTTRLALIAAFQRLPVRQRAALVLVDVVGYTPAEVGELLDVTTTSVRSLLQRARTTIAEDAPEPEGVTATPDLDGELIDRYMRALQRADTAELARLLAADVAYEMPPLAVWFTGREAVLDHHVRRVFSRQLRVLPVSANGYPALATYLGSAEGEPFAGHGIQVIEPRDGLIARITVFLDATLVARFGQPAALPAARPS
ncbi:RNA polymerase sigma-70 factor, ECF subfamily [Actinacidiphila rubida]|uniref:RNA polymerase sigma factor n=1 Tax=Actinacidiphila rubida TaxID=310780 RepID=A0A1H8STT3_9ACTN|nr:RNA polymerase subunit sigma-70 [Actinacidiphila rubida]SEO81744.1 RNA polymerase sigma-70 factor, ECF subfamily [Actinacidiphila rubida]